MDIEEIFKNLKQGNHDYNYEIEVSINDYINYINLGKTQKEKLQIFMMCYMSKPTVEELENWSLYDLINYIKETDTEFASDKDVIYQCGMTVAKDKKEKDFLSKVVVN